MDRSKRCHVYRWKASQSYINTFNEYDNVWIVGSRHVITHFCLSALFSSTFLFSKCIRGVLSTCCFPIRPPEGNLHLAPLPWKPRTCTWALHYPPLSSYLHISSCSTPVWRFNARLACRLIGSFPVCQRSVHYRLTWKALQCNCFFIFINPS